MLTTSGDGTAHIWQCAVSLNNERPLGGSSEEELEWAGVEDTVAVDTVSLSADGHNTYHQDTEDPTQIPTLRTPLQTLAGHTGVVISGDWLAGGDQVAILLT